MGVRYHDPGKYRLFGRLTVGFSGTSGVSSTACEADCVLSLPEFLPLLD